MVGASGWAEISHLPALARASGLRLTAVSTSRQESASHAAMKWGAAHHFTSAADLAHCPDVDLVTISVKAPAHRMLIEQVLDAGKPILCEWPLGTSAAESRYLARALTDRGIRAFIGLQATANPVLQQIGRLVRDGRIGPLLTVALTATRASKEPFPEGSVYTLHAENGAGMAEILGGHSLAALATAAGLPLSEVAPGWRAARLIQPIRDTDIGRQIIATTPDSVTATISMGPLTAALSLADGDVDPGTTISLIGTKGRIDAATVPSGELRLRQPQMANWAATIVTKGAVRELTEELEVLPLAARNPARLYQAIRNDLQHGTATAPTAVEALAVHETIDTWLAAGFASRRSGVQAP